MEDQVVPIMSLWVPIVLSAVIVFVASTIIHMVLTYHRTDFKKLGKEDEVLEAMRRARVSPGDYMAPCADSPAAMKDPAFVDRMKRGPLLIMTVAPGGQPSMATNLTLWFLYSVLVSLFAGYLASRAVAPGADYLEVFRFVGTSAFMGYSLGLLQNSIWYRRAWGTTLKSVFDGLVYALLTAGTFGWLWPTS
jgi:hypothetical protein